MDPSYDSAEELLERAFGKDAKATNFDWAAITDLSDEDHIAMNEIEDEIRQDWLAKHTIEQAEIEDEGEAFFFEVKFTFPSIFRRSDCSFAELVPAIAPDADLKFRRNRFKWLKLDEFQRLQDTGRRGMTA